MDRNPKARLPMMIEAQLADALHAVRRKNAGRINLLRTIGVGAFMLTITLIDLGFGQQDWHFVLAATVAYFVIAVVLLIGSKASSRVLWVSRFAVPVFDMPMVFLIQLVHMTIAEPGQRGNIAEFSVSLFVCLLMLSAFTLNSNQVVISLVLAVIFEQALQYRAGMTPAAHCFSLIVFGLATWICVFAGRNRVRLVETVTQANARRVRLQRYFSPGVGELLEQRDEEDLALGQECELTILFIDIRGFTALSEGLTGREAVEVLNSFHARMVEAIFQHGGTLDKYLGDGLMAYFNAPVSQPDHAERAVRCALTMLDELSSLNGDRSQQGKPTLKMGVGIHSGRAIVGDIGAPHRREFTAIGDAVNIASRLERMTKDLAHTVLVSEATARQVVEGVTWTEVGSFPIRGRIEPLLLYTPGTGRGSMSGS